MSLDEQIYGMILNKDFPIEKYDLEALSDFAVEIGAIGDKKQQILGKLIVQAHKKHGYGMIKHFAYVLDIPVATVESYFQVTRTLEGLDVPEDINWSFRKLIAHTDDPKETLRMVVDEGLSRVDLLNKLGRITHGKEMVCPHCKSHQPTKDVCISCHKSLKKKGGDEK